MSTDLKEPFYGAVIQFLCNTPDWAFKAFDWLYPVYYMTHNEQYKELEGMVKALDFIEYSQSRAVLLNSMFEIETWCTSVILKLANGTIIHSRNLDYENSNELRAVTYKAKFVKSGVY